MKLDNFNEAFKSEKQCRLAFKLMRDKQGVVCKKCGNIRQYWLKNIEQYQCSQCNFRTTLRSGTVMEASKLSFKIWLTAIFIMSIHKKGVSALEMQRILGLKRYEPVWLMMQKIRLNIGHIMENLVLDEYVEMDEGAFVAKNEKQDKDEKRKRGRGSQRNSKVLVMSKTEPIPAAFQKKNKKTSKFKLVKMQVIDAADGQTINDEANKSIQPESIIKTDGWSGYSTLKETHKNHQPEIVTIDKIEKVLPWVHIMISNAKRKLLGIHHHVDNSYLQNYLNEFCYKVNNRYSDMFDSLMNTMVRGTWYKKFSYVNG